MSESLDRRTLLKGAAASAAAINPTRGGARRAVRWTAVRSAGPVRLRPFQDAGARPLAATLCSPAPSGARGAAKDQLRGMGKNPLPRRLRPVRRWTGPVSGDLLPSRLVLPEGGPDARRRRAPRRGRSSTIRPISKCRRIRRRASCPKARASRACASRRPEMGRSTGARTTGSPSSGPPISAPSASSGNMACPRAASRSTSRSLTGRRSFPTSPTSTSSPASGTRSPFTR